MNHLTERKNEYYALFLTGCLMGVLCFIAVYGVKILNPGYDAWLLNGDLDLMQHYIGFGHYRNSSWTFPIGLISTLSKPYPMSVIYTDSIPLIAVFFKILSPLLPETFQYFGLYGCLSFALQGGCAMLLLHRVIKNRWFAVLASFFFILSFPILQRLYYHTALASHWLILLALIMWLYQDRDAATVKKCLQWGLLGFLCVSIHSYFLPMAGAIMLFAVIEQVIAAKKTGGKAGHAIFEGALEILSFCVCGILNLWILGGFYGGASAIGGGIGTFESNLNTFYNPMGEGITGISFPLYYDFQYEGFGYLGLGMLMLTAAILIGAVGILIIKRKECKWSVYLKTHHRQVLLSLLFLLFIVLACGPIYTWNDHRIFAVPLPGVIGRVADVFRSNGRMIWVSVYVLMLAVFVLIDRMVRRPVQVVALLLALLVQIIDLSGTIMDKQAYFNREQVYADPWDQGELQQIIAGKTEFILMKSQTMMMMQSAYHAFKHHMSINRFYYARNIDDKIEEQTEQYRQELLEGQARPAAVYVFEKEGFDGSAYPDLIVYEYGDHMIAVRKQK
ncbi:MAG: hypothetical protein IJU25_05480 [Lachnospiraceae bacterium]|nr:hypothetical protein [Lachnospiraceae bacterium]